MQHLKTKLGDEAVSFARADDTIVMLHLRDLAHRLTHALKTDVETVLPAIYDKIIEIDHQLTNLQKQLRKFQQKIQLNNSKTNSADA